MSLTEPLFTEYEERVLLAEIIKQSALPTVMLFNFLMEAQVDPQWTEIALPFGRSLSSCQRAWNRLRARTSTTAAAAATGAHGEIQNISLGDVDLQRANAAGRELQPRPPFLLPYSAGFSEAARLDNPGPPPRKKRGRPNKEEAERRAAEAKARGEEYPKRRPKTKKQSTASFVETRESPPDVTEMYRFSAPREASALSPGEASTAPSSGYQTSTPVLPSESQLSIRDAQEGRIQSTDILNDPPRPTAALSSRFTSASTRDFIESPTLPGQFHGHAYAADSRRLSQSSSSAGGPSIPSSLVHQIMPAQDPYGFNPISPAHSFTADLPRRSQA